MRTDKEIEGLIAQVQYRSSSAIRTRIRRRLEELWQHRARTGTHPGNALKAPRTLKLRPVAFAAAALIVLGVLGGLLHQSASPAYALEQTIAAVKDIRYFHLRFQGGSEEYDKEAWIEYDPEGSLPNVRVNFHTSDNNSAMVWGQGITQYWSQHSNQLSIFDDQEYTDKVLFFVRRYDPRQAIGYLQERAQEDGIQVQISQSADGAAPVTVTVDYDPNTFMIDRPKPRMRELFSIDPVSKLIRRVQVETWVEGRYVSSGVYEYMDYNQPFQPGLFDLKREAPADVSCSDTTGIAMGIEQGSLSDAEVAVRLVREFLDAWAAKDYEQAARIHGYMATGEAQSLRDKVLQRKNILRVVSIDSPTATERPLTGLLVPCTVEYEENETTKTGRFEFRVSPGSQNRWRIRDFQQKETPPSQTP
jgi:hypothetical protein